ncbi:VOC family protein [Shimia abyssi]|uniref:Catechol 2,3-dioxygenase-like lactoylglutathione lyase family enzyme n=1 Tax=Shimia abyssi TaxID=1662395 RepID=A0A2P8F9E3_9RHOB|nr:VOC family protein [Shimia abyssi]PSL18315.1 catechol 2,3-dioxygenase-like lactoylglutathione lyase family enzyme [Shimia abyssi]
MPELRALDHLVLTVANVDATIAFYCDVLGMQAERFQPADGKTRWALKFGVQKINLHEAGREFEPKAANATAGSADLCFLSDVALDDWQAHFTTIDIAVVDGPVERTGATGPIQSIYVRDPDGNLLEISNTI